MFVAPSAKQVSMKCTFAGCKEDVPFRVYTKHTLSSTGLRIDCDLEQVLCQLGKLLPGNAQVTRSVADLVIHSLCDKCWAKKDAEWGAGVYLGAAAKAAPEGVFFNTKRPDFEAANGNGVNMRKVKCTTVHEIIHWSVIPTTQGFQNAPQIKGMRGSDWDECMTDHLALTTYKALNWGPYDTMYNQMARFMDIGIDLLKTVSKAWFKSNGPKLQSCFPELGLNVDQPDPQGVKAEIEKIRGPLFQKLAHRYVKGNDNKLDPREPATLREFLENVFAYGSIGNKMAGSGGLYGATTH